MGEEKEEAREGEGIKGERGNEEKEEGRERNRGK